jgi:hypothetical protein
MIQDLENSDNAERSTIIMPNQAMSWQGFLCVCLLISVVTLAVAIPFYRVGLMLVLPYSGIESPKNNWHPSHLLVNPPWPANRGGEVSR